MKKRTPSLKGQLHKSKKDCNILKNPQTEREGTIRPGLLPNFDGDFTISNEDRSKILLWP